MKEENISSKQIEYSLGSDTWVPQKEVLHGSITWGSEKPNTIDDSNNGFLAVIDGVELSLGEFAKTILTHEGFDFRLEFIDPSDVNK